MRGILLIFIPFFLLGIEELPENQTLLGSSINLTSYGTQDVELRGDLDEERSEVSSSESEKEDFDEGLILVVKDPKHLDEESKKFLKEVKRAKRKFRFLKFFSCFKGCF